MKMLKAKVAFGLLPTVTAVAALAAPGSAQIGPAQPTLLWSNGLLGDQIAYELFAEPAKAHFLFVSFNQGPTFLGIFDPLNPLTLSVGTDLSNLAKFGFTNGVGQAQHSFPLPNVAVLDGVPLFAQSVVLHPFGMGLGLFDEVSNQTTTLLRYGGGSYFTPGKVVTPRQAHTTVATCDGQVFAIGGQPWDGQQGGPAIDTIEIYNMQAGTFTPVADRLQHGRAGHSATLLRSPSIEGGGTNAIVVLGGFDQDGKVSRTGDLIKFTPGAGDATVSPIAPMEVPRCQHTTTLLPDGRILVVGGLQNRLDNLLVPGPEFDLAIATANRRIDIYDPGSDTWTNLGQLPFGLFGHRATLVDTGDGSPQVVITGGVEVVQNPFGPPIPRISQSATRFDPNTGELQVAAMQLPFPTTHHDVVVLQDGTLILVGGTTGNVAEHNLTAVAETAVCHPGASWKLGPKLPAGAKACPNLELCICDDGVQPVFCASVFAFGGNELLGPDDDIGKPSLNIACLELVDGKFNDQIQWQVAGQTLVSRPKSDTVYFLCDDDVVPGAIQNTVCGFLTVGAPVMFSKPSELTTAEFFEPPDIAPSTGG